MICAPLRTAAWQFSDQPLAKSTPTRRVRAAPADAFDVRNEAVSVATEIVDRVVEHIAFGNGPHVCLGGAGTAAGLGACRRTRMVAVEFHLRTEASAGPFPADASARLRTALNVLKDRQESTRDRAWKDALVRFAVANIQADIEA